MMQRMLLTALTLLGSFAVQAGQVDLSCTFPTQNEDGTTLTDLTGTRFYEAQVTGGPYTLIADFNPPVCALSLQRDPGDWFYVATAYNSADLESQYSNEATKTVAPSPPDPPGNLIVTDDLVAYALSQTADIVVAYPVGTVPIGTPCNSSMRFNDKYVIPRAEVTWAGTVEPQVVFAACGGA